MRLAGHRPGEQGLAGAGRPGHQHAARSARPCLVIAAGVAQVAGNLADLCLHRRVAGHVGEPGGRAPGVDDPCLRLGQAALPAQPAQAPGLPAGASDAHVEQAADQQQRQQPGQHRQQRGGRGGGGGDLDVVGGQVTGETVAAERDRDGGGEPLPAGQAAGHLARRADGHRADRPSADIDHKPGAAQRHATGGAARPGQQRHRPGRDSRREQPAPPRGRVHLAGRARLGYAHRRAPSGYRGHPERAGLRTSKKRRTTEEA